MSHLKSVNTCLCCHLIRFLKAKSLKLRDVSISYLVLFCNVHTRVSYLVILYMLTPG